MDPLNSPIENGDIPLLLLIVQKSGQPVEVGSLSHYYSFFYGQQTSHFGGIKQYKAMVILRDVPYDNALLGLVI